MAAINRFARMARSYRRYRGHGPLLRKKRPGECPASIEPNLLGGTGVRLQGVR